MKTYFTLLISLCLGLEAQARIFSLWDYDALNDKATLVVIATPTAVTTTTNQMSFGTVTSSDSKPEDIMGTGIETSFRVLTVLKGDRNIKTFALRHFALAKPESVGTKVIIMNADGPDLISFEPNSHKLYLMFLQKEADGQYVAVSGQTDPVFSVKQLSENEMVWTKLNVVPTPNTK